MDEAIEANGKELTGEEEKYLEELYKPKPAMGFDTSMKRVGCAHRALRTVADISIQPKLA